MRGNHPLDESVKLAPHVLPPDLLDGHPQIQIGFPVRDRHQLFLVEVQGFPPHPAFREFVALLAEGVRILGHQLEGGEKCDETDPWQNFHNDDYDTANDHFLEEIFPLPPAVTIFPA